MEVEETQLTDPHSWKYADWMVVKILDLQRNIAIKSGIDETGGDMGCKTKTTERRLAFETRSDVLRNGDSLVGRSKNEFIRIKHVTLVRHGHPNILEIPKCVIHGVDLATTKISYDALGERNVVTARLKIRLIEWGDHMTINTKIFDFGIVKH